MIECKFESLSDLQDRELRKWLSAGQCKQLISVADGMLKEAQAEAANAAMQARGGNANYFELANLTIQKAFRIQNFLDVLNQIIERPADKPHQIAKLS